MQLGLVTYNVGKDWDLETLIRNLEAAHYSAVELRTTHKHGVEPALDRAGRERVLERFAKSSVRLLSLGTACEFHSPDAAVRRRNVDETQRFVELAHDLGAWGVKVRPNGLPEGVPEEVTLARIAEALRECGDIGERFGVEIWVEVHGRHTQQPARLRRILDLTNHANVGVCWNSNPADVMDGSVAEAFKLLGPYIKNVHLKELADEHAPDPANRYPYRELAGLLKTIGYDRYALCETQASPEPMRYLRNYRALWMELMRA